MSLWEIWLGILSQLFAGEPGAMDLLGFGGGCHRRLSCMTEERGMYIFFDQKDCASIYIVGTEVEFGGRRGE